jgi:hypothetical protein
MNDYSRWTFKSGKPSSLWRVVCHYTLHFSLFFSPSALICHFQDSKITFGFGIWGCSSTVLGWKARGQKAAAFPCRLATKRLQQNDSVGASGHQVYRSDCIIGRRGVALSSSIFALSHFYFSLITPSYILFLFILLIGHFLFLFIPHLYNCTLAIWTLRSSGPSSYR